MMTGPDDDLFDDYEDDDEDDNDAIVAYAAELKAAADAFGVPIPDDFPEGD
jgi:hypothetical protein